MNNAPGSKNEAISKVASRAHSTKKEKRQENYGLLPSLICIFHYFVENLYSVDICPSSLWRQMAWYKTATIGREEKRRADEECSARHCPAPTNLVQKAAGLPPRCERSFLAEELERTKVPRLLTTPPNF